MPTPPTPRAPHPAPPDDSLDELPDLDGAEGEDDDAAPPEDLEEGETPGDAVADGHDPFDDATGEDAPVDDLETGEETSWLADSEPAHFDLDAPSIGEESEASLLADNDELGVDGEDFGFEDDRAEATDGGEEGPTDADEELNERDLPDLDAGDDGEVDEATLFELPSDDEAVFFAWDRTPWVQAGPVVDVGAVTHLACTSRGIAAAVRGGGGTARLVALDLEGAVAPIAAEGLPAADVSALACPAVDVLRVVVDGRAYRSTDGGATFAPADDPPSAPTFPSATEASRELALRGAAGEQAQVTAAAYVGAGGEVVAALSARAEGRSWLVRWDRRDDDSASDATTIAEITAAQVGRAVDVEVTALAWDAVHGLLWAGGAFGVLALHPPQK